MSNTDVLIWREIKHCQLESADQLVRLMVEFMAFAWFVAMAVVNNPFAQSNVNDLVLKHLI